MIRHDDHYDFLVNGSLHYMDGEHCQLHGSLAEIDQDTLGVLTGLDELKGAFRVPSPPSDSFSNN
jgi:hypothetical protein